MKLCWHLRMPNELISWGNFTWPICLGHLKIASADNFVINPDAIPMSAFIIANTSTSGRTSNGKSAEATATSRASVNLAQMYHAHLGGAALIVFNGRISIGKISINEARRRGFSFSLFLTNIDLSKCVVYLVPLTCSH